MRLRGRTGRRKVKERVSERAQHEGDASTREETTHETLGPIQGLFFFTNSYASCIPRTSPSSSTMFPSAASRITIAITNVALLEIPHWQLKRRERG